MSTWPIDFNPRHLYFITTRAIQAAHLFRRDVMKQILVDSLAYMQTQQWLNLYAFVVMPNHIHLIVRCQVEYPVSDSVRDFKKHTAKQLIATYQQDDNQQAQPFCVRPLNVRTNRLMRYGPVNIKPKLFFHPHSFGRKRTTFISTRFNLAGNWLKNPKTICGLVRGFI